MKIFFVLIMYCLSIAGVFAQSISGKLQSAFRVFESDPQLKYAISSLYVIDATTGQVIFEKNAQAGLAPASTQKIVTAVTAFELLGQQYRYKTVFVTAKDVDRATPFLFIHGSGDPTFGSDRFAATRDTAILRKLYDAFPNMAPAGITIYDTGAVPDGYIWQDIGNYYGAGHYQLNWKENQYDIYLDSYEKGTLTKVAGINMDTTGYTIENAVTAGEPGSGDNAYIYCAPFSNKIVIRGTIPPNRKAFSISGSLPDPPAAFGTVLKKHLERRWQHPVKKTTTNVSVSRFFRPLQLPERAPMGYFDTIYTHYSPPLDTIAYWFLRKSINLYGEALLNTLASTYPGAGNAAAGIKQVKTFWKEKGIDENELNISDGSGLSPQNRVTTHAQVEILKYAKGRPWFASFYQALPEYNGMKMKSGTIKDVKAFCGYHKAGDGRDYIFSFIVNNYSGSASALVSKMYKVLDVLK